VGEAEEVEGAGLLSSTRAPSRPDPRPERNDTCLVEMKFQTERCEPVAQLGQESLGIFSVLKPHDGVVGAPHGDHVAAVVGHPASGCEPA
jgi:hypothetical protein